MSINNTYTSSSSSSHSNIKPKRSRIRTRDPSKSYGIILLKYTEILLIQRKDSFGFIDCVKNRGIESYIHQSFVTLTKEEATKLQVLTFEELVDQVCKNTPSPKRILEWKENFNNMNIRSKVRQLKHLQHETDWDIPKGHPEKFETNIECALRELHEETGFTTHQLDIIPNTEFHETFTGTNGQQYENIYYIGVLKHQTNWTVMPRLTHETRQLKWWDLTDSFIPWKTYQSSKITLIKNVLSWLNHNINIS